MDYNKQIVKRVKDVYRDYMIANWNPGNKTGVMGHRKYAELKKEAIAHALSAVPKASYFYDAWMKLMSEHNGSGKAHAHVTNAVQETGRRTMIGLSHVTTQYILNKGDRVVMKPNGQLMGKREKKVPEPVEEEVKPPGKRAVVVEPEQPATSSVTDELKWRLMDCVAATGSIPAPSGLSALFGVTRDEASQAINWLKRTHIVNEKDGYFLVTPKQIDAKRLIELAKDGNPLEKRTLDIVLDALFN